VTREQYSGCILGLALGDALGAPYEGGPIERFVWRMICSRSRGKSLWTDDTRMSLDLAESLLETGGLNCDDLAHRFAASYTWSRGYGPGTAGLLKRIRKGEDWRKANRSIYPGGSFGNGAAMRAPVIGLFYAGRHDELVEAARLSAEITHAHALGIEGAVLLACAAADAVRSKPADRIVADSAAHCKHTEFTSRLELAASWLHEDNPPDAGKVVRHLGNGIAAYESCVTALFIGLSFLEKSFEDMLAFTIRCGGDVDTIGAMAGAVWGASRGSQSLPRERLERLEDRERIESIGYALYEKVHA
jgi:poly(ADP-ribose) glycohydrolase ARH3